MKTNVFPDSELLGFLSKKHAYFGSRLTILEEIEPYNGRWKVNAILSSEEEEIFLDRQLENGKSFIVLRAKQEKPDWFYHQAASLDQVEDIIYSLESEILHLMEIKKSI